MLIEKVEAVISERQHLKNWDHLQVCGKKFEL